MGTITVSNLGKAYKQYPNKWMRLKEWITPSKKNFHKLTWVLEDINFTVKSGEAVGIIGINGAGKSTLLKLITGTTQPTKGSVRFEGKVAALLELGMGFHPDFTGRQNAFMAGQLLGISNADIIRLMPEIEAFAEIGAYIDQPVRVYSSGMQMRLAFSVATAIRPDILIVDEALSVGDSYFQHKSFERIREFRKQGTTLLLVSHDRQAIQSICDRSILLNKGRIEIEGDPESVMDYYNALLADNQNQKIEQVKLDDGSIQTISGTGAAVVSNIAILNLDGEKIEIVAVGQKVNLLIEVLVKENLPKLVLGYGIKDRLGQVIYGTNTFHTKQVLEDVNNNKFTYKFTFDANLGPGSYSIQTSLSSSDTHLADNYEWRDLALVFNVVNMNKPHFEGIAWLGPEIEVCGK